MEETKRFTKRFTAPALGVRTRIANAPCVRSRSGLFCFELRLRSTSSGDCLSFTLQCVRICQKRARNCCLCSCACSALPNALPYKRLRMFLKPKGLFCTASHSLDRSDLEARRSATIVAACTVRSPWPFDRHASYIPLPAALVYGLACLTEGLCTVHGTHAPHVQGRDSVPKCENA